MHKLSSYPLSATHPLAMSSFPKLELFYFDIPGKGEAIRLHCAFAGLPLKDTRLSRDQFTTMKEDGKLPYGQVPLLIVDEKNYIAQSASIMRYLGKLSGLYPSDPFKAALVDSIIDEENDLFAALTCSRYRDRFGFGCLDDSTVATVRADLNNVVLPRHLKFFQDLLSKSSTGWLADTQNPTIADFIVVPRMQWLAGGNNDGISLTILDDNAPAVNELISKMMNLDAVKSFYAP